MTPAILDHLWQSTLVVLAAGLLVLALRKAPAGVRHGLWMAASLKFLVDGHRVTVYVYNSERVALGSPLQRRVVRNEPVYTGWKRGYSIATADHHGVGYAVATDLGEDEGAEIVASLH